MSKQKTLMIWLEALRGLSWRTGRYLTSGVAWIAIYRLLCHLNLWKKIDYQGVRSEHLSNRFFTIASNGEISIIDYSRHATVSYGGRHLRFGCDSLIKHFETRRRGRGRRAAKGTRCRGSQTWRGIILDLVCDAHSREWDGARDMISACSSREPRFLPLLYPCFVRFFSFLLEEKHIGSRVRTLENIDQKKDSWFNQIQA